MNSSSPASKLYRGRFAPSPTGPLHFGSLVTAVGSYLQARSCNGEWLLRIEDLDPPREQKGAAEHIIKTLDSYGFEWDGAVSYQSQRHELYQNALEQLIDNGHCFSCRCSRKKIHQHTEELGLNPHIYPGICRDNVVTDLTTDAIRVRVLNQHIHFDDLLQREQRVGLVDEVGDFILKRADGLYAYQLAVTVDDAEQKISEVVRGIDLLSSTPHQYYLQELLNYPHPNYFHLPVVNNQQGEKLSKQTYAKAIEVDDASKNLVQALLFLGQAPEAALARATVQEIWSWALENWQTGSIPPHSRTMIESENGQQ
ncbi:MAG: tRNA glutamyl-Q(34) synthetase GluQRS [Gammaproteobacteria bacterium]|nr:tRNA glutamyl-Q(34) synthetase GluQRS [Gammaproteobacteria bacterium]